MQILNLFTTPIYISKLDGDIFDQVQKELSIVDTDSFINASTFDPLNTMVSETVPVSKLIEKYKCVHFEKQIHDHLREYLKQIGLNVDAFTYRIDNSWMTRSDQGKHTQVHHHDDSDISGVYYYKTNTKDGNFYFRSPNKSLETSYVYSKSNYSRQDWEVIPQMGMLILFPSWLDHGVRSNVTDDTRMSVSFNLIFKNSY